MCVTPIHEITSLFRKGHDNNVNENDEMELSLHTLSGISPTFISNITVNDWQMNIDDESRHKLMIAFSSEGVEIIGKDQQEKLPNFKGCFKPEHMRSSSAMAISGAALSFDMGEYESGGLNALLELLNLPGLGMGDEMMCDQCQVTKQKASKRVSD